MTYILGVVSYIALKFNFQSVSKFALRKSLTNQMGEKEGGLSIYLRRSGHSMLLHHINNMNIDSQYKLYLNALVYRHEKKYPDAYRLIENIDSPRVLFLKVKLLYDLKLLDSIVALSNKDVDVLKYLKTDQRFNLMSYLVRRNMYDEAEQLIQITEVEKDLLIEQFEDDKNDVFYKYTWRQYADKFLGVTNFDDIDLRRVKEKIDGHNTQMRKLGYTLVINEYYLNNENLEILKKEFVPFVRENSDLNQYIEFEALNVLEIADDRKNGKSLKLQRILNYYHSNHYSENMLQTIYELIPEVNLNIQHIMSLRRMILDNQILLEDQRFGELLKWDRRLHIVFHYPQLFTNRKINNEIDAFVHDHLSTREQKRIYNTVIKKLVRYNFRLELPQFFIEHLKETAPKRMSSAIVLGKYYCSHNDLERVDQVVSTRTKDKQYKLRINFSKYLFQLKAYDLSLSETHKAASIKPYHHDVIRSFIRNYHVIGDITGRFKNVKLMKKYYSPRLFPREYQMAAQEFQLLNTEWEVPITLRNNDDVTGNAKKVLYVLNKALPVINGYTIRSNEIVKRVQDQGYEVVQTTRLGWSPKHENYEMPTEDIDGIKTYYIDQSEKYLTNRTPLNDYFNVYAEELLKIIKAEKPGIIHAASNFQNALPSLKVGRMLGLRTVYEVRGMWHHTQTSKNPSFYKSDRFNLQDDYEIICCRTADEVLCISESLKAYLVSKGIDEGKISVVPNGVDTEDLTPSEPDPKIVDALNLKDTIVLGFIGSITNYEGLGYIIEAVKNLNESRVFDKRVKFLVVGDGQYLTQLQSKVSELGIEDDVIFKGKVPHDQVAKFYSVIDITPFPRTQALVCQLVTPIKTYEAMSMAKKVIVSDVAALKEMVIDGENGTYFEAENGSELEQAIVSIAKNEEIGQNAREWVKNHRDWQVLLETITDIYEKKGVEA
ncbi:glycosyltransferase family 4 protein [Salinicoccus albus]|uniref:glycosyltransferase family 4 protein n=1 Tax=Salinicoccus albus TaxID=418756 RepID=UPI000377C6CB|nr:glycosyltransferase family 4 protein [Salinicoccus albus]